jgi:hypothetical protein
VLSVLFFPQVAVKLLGPGPDFAPAKAPVTEQEIHGMAAADGG